MKLKIFANRWWAIALLLFVYASAQGQITVSGNVSDAEDGTPLIGVNILIKETSTGTITDFDGNFSVTVPDANSTLVITYTGYEPQEITVGNKTDIKIALSTGSALLDEIVVVGYTTRKKGELTGSVSSVSNEQLERTTNKDLAKSLAGKVPGLIVSDRGGYPGSTSGDDITILIRGKSTLGDNAPLILIDGITAASFSHLAPQDVESISVLKDGAAAIYGARAANGVILVTTKRGQAGKARINFSTSYNLSSFSATPDLMTSEQHAIYSNEYSQRLGLPLPFTEEQIANYAAGNDPINFPSTDWADLTFADYSPELRSSLSISGGADKVNYFISGDFIDQVGMYESGDLTFRQYQVRSNIDIKLHETFTLGLDLSGRFGDTNEPGVDAGFIYKHIYTNEPTEVGIYPNGLVAYGGENGANPFIMSSNESGYVNRISNNLRSRISYDWKLDWLVDGLSLNGFAGIRKWNTDTKSWYTPWEVFTFQQGSNQYIPSVGSSQRGPDRILRETFWKYDELMLNATIRYNKTFSRHSIGAFVGTERFNSEQREFWAERKGFPSDDRPELFAGGDDGQLSTGGSAEFARLNYFGSVSYDYKKKYFLDLTVRHDGSGNFGSGNRFGTFPGIAAAWSIGEENFLNGFEKLSALKLRASWAIMGNDRVGQFQYLTRYNYNSDPTNVGETTQPNYYIFGTPGTRYNGYTSANVPNPDITWETADMKNLGLSFAFFDYKFTGDINYFFQKREDILIQRNASIPLVAGISLPAENLGKVDNFGWEAQLGWNDTKGKVKYNFGVNFTQAKNRVVYLDEAADVPEQLKREGYSIDSYIVYPTGGIFRDQEQIDATDVVLQGTVPGEPIYLDTNGDGVIDAGDRIRIRSSNVPEMQFGILGGFSVNRFDFNFLFTGQAKAEMLVFFDQSGAKPQHVFDQRWTPNNPDSRYPRAFTQGDAFSGNQNSSDNFQGADLWLHDASFLRLKEVEVGYTFSKEKIKIGDLRLFFRGLNLLTMFSEVYDLGLDPEASGYDNFRQSTYPSLKSYAFGVNINFE